VLEVDLQRQRIALTMRMGDEPTQGQRHDNAPANRGNNQSRPQRPGGNPQGGPRSTGPAPAGNAMASAFAKLRK
jgi:uncharacterized protein